MASSLYNTGLEKILNNTINLNASADVRCLLLKSSGYTFDADHDFVSDLTTASNEISVSGYSRQALTGEVITRVDASDRVMFDANDVTFSALVAGQTVGAAVLYVYNASDSSAQLIAYIDLTDTATNGGDIVIQWHANGIFYIPVA